MAHTIVGKLNKPANEIPTQNGTGFGIRLGVQYYDRETKKKEWVNYEAVIFASQPTQAQYYKDVLVVGSVIEISGESLKIKQFQGQNGMSLSLEIINAKLGYVHAGQANQQQQAYQQQPQQQAYAAPQQQYAQPQQYAQQQQPPQQQYTQQPPQQQAVSPQGQPYNQGFSQPTQPQPQNFNELNDQIPF